MTPLDELAEYLRKQVADERSQVQPEDMCAICRDHEARASHFARWLTALEQAQQNERVWIAETRCHFNSGPAQRMRFLLQAPNVDAARTVAACLAQGHARTDAALLEVVIMEVVAAALPLSLAAQQEAP